MCVNVGGHNRTHEVRPWQQNTTRNVLRVAVKIPKGLLEQVEDFQFARRLNSRVAALRQLIEIGLEANSPWLRPTLVDTLTGLETW